MPTLSRNDFIRAAGGRIIDSARAHLLYAASAIVFLAFRTGSCPDERPVGRILAEDLQGTDLALDRRQLTQAPA